MILLSDHPYVTFKQALETYASFLMFEKGLQANTQQAYLLDLRIFNEMLCQLKDAGRLHTPTLRELSLEEAHTLIHEFHQQKKVRSIARMLIAVRMFCFFAEEEYHLSIPFIHRLPLPSFEMNFKSTVSKDTLRKVLSSVESAPSMTPRERFRNGMIIKLLYVLGVRVSELVALNIRDFNLKEGYVRVIGKGERMRIIPIHRKLQAEVVHYLAACRKAFVKENAQNNAFFLSRMGKRLSRISLWKVVHHAFQHHGGVRISPHTLRHAFATHLLQNGAHIREIQELLGHRYLSTTQLYTHLNIGDLRRAIETHHPYYYADF